MKTTAMSKAQLVHKNPEHKLIFSLKKEIVRFSWGNVPELDNRMYIYTEWYATRLTQVLQTYWERHARACVTASMNIDGHNQRDH